MRLVRQLLAFVACAAFATAANAAAPSAHYSFADLYRVAVGAAPQVSAPQPSQVSGPAHEYQQYQMRVASTAGAAAAQEAPAFTYSSSSLPRPSRWLLFLSGLALVAWVARRRLGYSL